MKHTAAMFCAAVTLSLAGVAVSSNGEAGSAPDKGEGKVIAQAMVETNATVKAIDMKKRLITLVGSDGKEQTFVVDKAVRRLNEVHVGDTIKARYKEAISVKINKVKAAPGADVQASISPDEKSAKPAGKATVRVTAVASIEKLSNDGRKATLKMPDGETLDVKVRDPQNQEKIKKGEIKVGDQIEITYNRALALSVEKTDQK